MLNGKFLNPPSHEAWKIYLPGISHTGIPRNFPRFGNFPWFGKFPNHGNSHGTGNSPGLGNSHALGNFRATGIPVPRELPEPWEFPRKFTPGKFLLEIPAREIGISQDTLLNGQEIAWNHLRTHANGLGFAKLCNFVPQCISYNHIILYNVDS